MYLDLVWELFKAEEPELVEALELDPWLGLEGLFAGALAGLGWPLLLGPGLETTLLLIEVCPVAVVRP